MQANDKQKRDQEESQARLHDAMREVVQNAQCRYFLWWLLGECGIYRQNVSANSTMYIMEGQRSIGLKVISLMGDVSPLAYPELQIEQARAVLASRVDGEDDFGHIPEDVG